MSSDPAYMARLGGQSLGRPLTSLERRLADEMESIFRSGEHDFVRVAERLQQSGVPFPSGATGSWDAVTLEAELRQINDSLDQAYRCVPGPDVHNRDT